MDDAAGECARQVLRLACGVRRPTSHGALSSVAGALEVAFAWRARRPDDEEWRSLASEGVKLLRQYGKMFPIAKPEYLYWRAAEERLLHRDRAARWHLRRAAAVAHRMELWSVEQRILEALRNEPADRRA